MNINFINNIDTQKNPTFIVISSISDLNNVNKFPNLFKNTVISFKKIKNIAAIIDKNRFTKLNIVTDNIINELVIFKTTNYSHTKSLMDGGLLYKTIYDNKYKNINLIFSRSILNKKNNYVNDMLTGLAIRSFKFDKYFTEKKNHQIDFDLNVFKDSKYRNKFKYDNYLVDSINETKSLVSEPANVLYPESYANRCLKLKKLGLNVKILNKKQLEKIGMNALLGVAQGSVKSPKVVIIEWKMKKKSKPIVLIGKGVTFDTGGISIKPSRGMQEMIMDMGGSAVVVGSMMNAALNRINKPIVGIIGLVENMPDGNAQRPGDIVRTLSGKTVEVLNTDAEGRLVLADLITYIQNIYKPHSMIDFATLTGAVQAALGPYKAGLFSNNEILSKKLITSGDITGEKLWRMPLGDEYDKEIDGSMADISNIGRTPYAGASTAAEFIHRFVENKIPWAHLDIAGVTWSNSAKGLNSKGATGFAVRLINQFLKSK